MSIRWDPALVRGLAGELDALLAGTRLRAVRLDGASRDLVLLFRERILVWRLHPERGWLTLGEPVEPDPSDLRMRARVRRVAAPPDERLLRVELLPERGRRGGLDLVVELLGNRLNAIVAEGPDRIIRHVLVRREGARPQRVGERYEPPPSTERLVEADPEAWTAALGPERPEARASALVRRFAWTSPLNAEHVLGAAGREPDEALLTTAYERWRRVVEERDVDPCLVEGARGPQPYPFPLPGRSTRPVGSLLEGFARCAEDARAAGERPPAVALGPERVAALDAEVRRHERRLARLRAELRELEDPEALRGLGDLILARYRDIPGGAREVTLTGFDGGPVRVELDPALPPHQNADRYYDRASRATRARVRLPGLIEEAERALGRYEALARRASEGTLDADELAAALPERPARGGRRTEAEALPYRTFRSSGGLEIRVGRGARHNDALTFRHAAPGDVWLHARHTAGAHVVLRWRGDGAPPARDLQEAATLAALHSKARTSGSVPVDWTYRKYVRKPRGAAGGSVVAERVRTLFVAPDEALLERLSDGA